MGHLYEERVRERSVNRRREIGRETDIQESKLDVRAATLDTDWTFSLTG